ncbi:hypothetical protein [Phaffia rhodozyma]|uniref:Uncharacterized protein n=1 Tax=Phaffia rhodozyma TaxID=264483 RepID=A0A0F7SHJ7_PHARH|nr:hypothetical protein [Phaffia rhodozyma]
MKHRLGGFFFLLFFLPSFSFSYRFCILYFALNPMRLNCVVHFGSFESCSSLFYFPSMLGMDMSMRTRKKEEEKNHREWNRSASRVSHMLSLALAVCSVSIVYLSWSVAFSRSFIPFRLLSPSFSFTDGQRSSGRELTKVTNTFLQIFLLLLPFHRSPFAFWPLPLARFMFHLS